MGNIKSKLSGKKSDAVVAKPQVIKPKIYQNQRQVIYSYLPPKELLKVASLSYRERQTVINSKIVKENRKYKFFSYKFDSLFSERYSSDVAINKRKKATA